MKKQTRGWGTYLLVIIILVVVFMYLPSIMNQTRVVSNRSFQEALDGNQVVSATIEQNT